MNIVLPQQQVSIASANSESDRCRSASPYRGMDLALVSRDTENTRHVLVGALTTNHLLLQMPFSNG
ncbi:MULTISPECIES: hypothetical protein [Planktothricoides]|uniref:Uncharacterized protein n=2 Tax=Planktothricoides raciborskii TaxID=132608 RepID=A0AAU8JET5_9CYAN|nr:MULTISPECIES: hypothetical protein [Planktothricoides]MBD2545885.1 hypothetical protein [Planktothricoides raciborskii FACHB-1370]MBD2584143.1 hypothetical protein [Planktothricoides raciborskii FACHB-1261]